jgi:hypothetical protein
MSRLYIVDAEITVDSEGEVEAKSRYYPSVFSEGLRKTIKTSGLPVFRRDSNRAPLERRSRTVPLDRQTSVEMTTMMMMIMIMMMTDYKVAILSEQSTLTRDFLSSQFADRWISRDGITAWPPCSPDFKMMYASVLTY